MLKGIFLGDLEEDTGAKMTWFRKLLLFPYVASRDRKKCKKMTKKTFFERDQAFLTIFNKINLHRYISRVYDVLARKIILTPFSR